jgi:phosphatidylinositol kinase/protein kinase (PI-3  family)
MVFCLNVLIKSTGSRMICFVYCVLEIKNNFFSSFFAFGFAEKKIYIYIRFSWKTHSLPFKE